VGLVDSVVVGIITRAIIMTVIAITVQTATTGYITLIAIMTGTIHCVVKSFIPTPRSNGLTSL